MVCVTMRVQFTVCTKYAEGAWQSSSSLCGLNLKRKSGPYRILIFMVAYICYVACIILEYGHLNHPILMLIVYGLRRWWMLIWQTIILIVTSLYIFLLNLLPVYRLHNTRCLRNKLIWYKKVIKGLVFQTYEVCRVLI